VTGAGRGQRGRERERGALAARLSNCFLCVRQAGCYCCSALSSLCAPLLSQLPHLSPHIDTRPPLLCAAVCCRCEREHHHGHTNAHRHRAVQGAAAATRRASRGPAAAPAAAPAGVLVLVELAGPRHLLAHAFGFTPVALAHPRCPTLFEPPLARWNSSCSCYCQPPTLLSVVLLSLLAVPACSCLPALVALAITTSHCEHK
jgi:hypothetical protein